MKLITISSNAFSFSTFFAYNFKSSTKNRCVIILVCSSTVSANPSSLTNRYDSGFTARINKMRLKVSPCSIPFRYSSSSVSIDVVSPCSVSLVFHLVIRLLIAFMIFAGIFARRKLSSIQLCGTESNAFL